MAKTKKAEPVHSHSLASQISRTLRGSPLLATWLAFSVLFGLLAVGFTAALVFAQRGIVEDEWSLHDIAERLPPMLRERLSTRAAPSALEFDHVVLLVDDLDVAMREFRKHGFNVTYGGVHAGGWTHNALIKFPDHSYVELLATHSPTYRFLVRTLARFGLLRPLLSAVTDPFKQRFLQHLAGFDGVRDVVLRAARGGPLSGPELLDQFASSGRASAPTEMSRVTPHNEVASWRTVIPPSISLPFLIEWTNRPAPRSINETSHHNNGTRVLGIEIAVPDLAAAAAQWEQYLGIPALRDGLLSERRLPEEVSPTPYPVRFELANRQFIRLVEPGFSGPLRELLDRTVALSRGPLSLGGVCSSLFLETGDEERPDLSQKQQKVGTVHFNLYDARFTFVPRNLIQEEA